VIRLDEIPSGDDGKRKIQVTYRLEDGAGGEFKELYDTVIWAIGRSPVNNIGLQKAGVKLSPSNRVIVQNEQSNIPGIYAIGDIIEGGLELTPVAIQAGQLLARRIFGKSTSLMDYVNVPTTVFTPQEYGACGYSEEAAIQKFGKANIEVYWSRFGVLESAPYYPEAVLKPRSHEFTGKNHFHRRWELANGRTYNDWDEKKEDEEFDWETQTRQYLKQDCLAKLVCDKKNNNRVIGFHYVGPNAGEITQGFALGLKAGATKAHFDDLVGIHPTAAEEFTTLKTVKSSGDDFMKKGGC